MKAIGGCDVDASHFAAAQPPAAVIGFALLRSRERVLKSRSLPTGRFRPKSFAGLFGAAPSIALATLGLTIASEGPDYAATEARSMVLGAIAFFCYAAATSWLLWRYKPPSLTATLSLMPIWFGVSFALWLAVR